jgi:predicted transcriptional regulator
MAQKPIGYYGEFRPTGVDTSAARRFEALAGMADQANDIAFNIAAKKRAEQGQEAGLAAGIAAAEEGKPIEKEKGFLSGISIFDQAYNSALEKSFVASIDTDARENIARIAEESNGDIVKFDEISAQYLKGLSSGISEDYKNVIQLSIDPVVASSRSQVQSQYIVRERQETDERLINNINSAVDSGVRLGSLGDTEGAMTSLQSATESINARVESTAISQSAADILIKNAAVTVESSLGRGALKNTYQERGAIAAVDFIETVQDTPIKGFTVKQQDTLVDVLKQDLNQYMQLENIKEKQSEEILTSTQSTNASNLFLGIMNGQVDSGQVAIAGGNQDINFTQLTQLTGILNSRGQGVDDYAVIREAQGLMVTDPDAALTYIVENTNTNISGGTSQQLYQNALSARDSESLINTSRAIRFKSFLENSVIVKGPLGSLDEESQKRLAKLELVYNERVLAGDDPAIVASELIDVNELILNPIDDAPNKLLELEASWVETVKLDPKADSSTFDHEYERINNYIKLKGNADAFQSALDKALKRQ